MVILILAAAMLLTLLTGCGKGGSNTAAISMNDFSQRAQDSLANLHSYETNLQMTVNASGIVEGNPGSVDIIMGGNGAVDITAKKMGMDMSANIKGKSGSESINQASRISTYVIDDVLYTGTTNDNGNMEWKHETASSSVWEEEVQSDQLVKLLGSSQIDSLKTETVEGQQCYLAEVTPDPSQLWDTIMNQMNQSGEGSSFTQDMGNAIKKVTVKYWFIQDTMFIKKAYVYMEMDMDAQALGAESGSMNFVIEMTVIFNNHNQSVKIELPSEAQSS